MNRITIKYWQELPELVGELKRANSQLIYEWQKYFNPARSYITSINLEDVRITFEGDYWRVATRLFQLFCEDYQVRLNLNTYMWLAMHTTIINKSLLGDEEFNEYIHKNNGYQEVEEFVDSNKLVNWHGEDFQLHYNHRDMDMLQRMGMEIVPNRYQFKSKSGYYLPIDIHITYNRVIENWIRREGKDHRKYQLTHSPRLTIMGLEKDAIFDLAVYLYQQEGLYELLIQWVDEPSKVEYQVNIGGTILTVKDRWAECNQDYVESARGLTGISYYQLEAFKVQDILRHSNYTTYGIKLDEGYYQRLTIPKEEVIRGTTQLYGNTYSREEVSLGRGVPISVDIRGVQVKTPYNLVEDGVYSDITLPLVNEMSYTEREYTTGIDISDTDIRIVLRTQTNEPTKQELSVDELITVDTTESYPLESYPTLDTTRIQPFITDITNDYLPTVKPKRIMYTLEDMKYVPYIVAVEDTGERLYISYSDGEELDLSKTDKHIRSRVVFRDRVGVSIHPYIENLTNVLLSLATDELEPVTSALKGEIKGQGAHITTLIDKWLETLITGDKEGLISHIQGFRLGNTVNEDKNPKIRKHSKAERGVTAPYSDSEEPYPEEPYPDTDDFDIFEDIGLL